MTIGVPNIIGAWNVLSVYMLLGGCQSHDLGSAEFVDVGLGRPELAVSHDCSELLLGLHDTAIHPSH